MVDYESPLPHPALIKRANEFEMRGDARPPRIYIRSVRSISNLSNARLLEMAQMTIVTAWKRLVKQLGDRHYQDLIYHLISIFKARLNDRLEGISHERETFALNIKR